MQKLFGKAFLWGFVALIPLVVLELINRRQFQEEFPFSVFGFTWVLQSLFILLTALVLKNFRTAKVLKEKLYIVVLQLALLGLIAFVWSGWIIDQWPCLMGVPHCD